ncbi:MAG: hypothetical protein HOP02_00150 [Methylococcaceae bacterium]|nr:hypothetical protein [Methylococcaceae bacterium]
MNNYRKPLSFIVCLYLLLLTALAALPYWPASTWVIANLISFSPLWVYALPLLILTPLSLLSRQYRLVVALFGALLICVKLSGWVFNFNATPGISTSAEGLTVDGINNPLVIITANLGEGGKVERLNQLMVENNADLVALQETSVTQLTPLLNLSPLHSVCVEELCLLSHLNLKLVDSKSRVLLQNSGRFAMQVQVDLPSGAFDFYVLHLETPREGFETLIANRLTDWRKMVEVVDDLMAESWIASSLVAQGRNPIVAGDFNLPRLHPIYEKYWGWLTDSFHEAGNGLGYTKHTRLHGVQIDHILHSESWTAAKTWIGPSLGGDHLPVITVLSPSKNER